MQRAVYGSLSLLIIISRIRLFDVCLLFESDGVRSHTRTGDRAHPPGTRYVTRR